MYQMCADAKVEVESITPKNILFKWFDLIQR